MFTTAFNLMASSSHGQCLIQKSEGVRTGYIVLSWCYTGGLQITVRFHHNMVNHSFKPIYVYVLIFLCSQRKYLVVNSAYGALDTLVPGEVSTPDAHPCQVRTDTHRQGYTALQQQVRVPY